MMLNTIRGRLFASYLAVLLIALAVLSGVLFTLLKSREAPPEFTWNRLELMLSGFLSGNFMQTVGEIANGNQSIESVVANFAELNDVRLLILGVNQNEAVALYDSDEQFEFRQNMLLGLADAVPMSDGRMHNPNLIFGRFQDTDNSEWLFTGISRPDNRPRNSRYDRFILMLAQPPSTESLQSALGDFSALFLEPLLRSALIGGFLAFAFAMLISQSIVRSLQALAKSAQHVAEGEYNQQVPENGPSEIQQVATAFNHMTAQVRANQQSQREFVANVSHDLKTPLTSIQGYSQAIMDGAAKDPTDAARIIHDEAERLNRMVTELTDLARLQAGRLSMKITALDIGEIVSAIAQRLLIVAEQKNIQLHVQNHPMPQIGGDGDRLVQVFTNLLSNAIKYTPEGGQVWIETDVRNGGVEVVVKDNGIGIPPEDLPRIFERFYQVDKSRGPRRGTGLGLAITQEIVEAHGGTIDITSAGWNQGTTVTVWLPSAHLTTLVRRR
jgi:signal transduction histidine kinase